jgi:hypothetical protein
MAGIRFPATPYAAAPPRRSPTTKRKQKLSTGTCLAPDHVCFFGALRPLKFRRRNRRGDSQGRMEMSPIKSLRAVFDTADLELLQTVYEEACLKIGIDPKNVDEDEENGAHAVMLAVLDAAESGERDPQILKVRALAGFSKPRQ